VGNAASATENRQKKRNITIFYKDLCAENTAFQMYPIAQVESFYPNEAWLAA
jgi:hypothetical protein